MHKATRARGATLFPLRSFDPECSNDNVLEDLKCKNIHKLPPGYKDSGKSDEGIGDLLIWYTILEIGQKYNKHVVFVSGDEKADWFYSGHKKALYPRFELVEEFYRKTEGKSFHIIPLSRLLEIRGVKSQIVSEVRNEEEQARSIEALQIIGFSPKENDYYSAVTKWILKNLPHAKLSISSESSDNDMSIVDFFGWEHNVIVEKINPSEVGRSIRRIRERLGQTLFTNNTMSSDAYIFLILPGETFADIIQRMVIDYIGGLDMPTRDVNIICGYISGDNEFVATFDMHR